MTNVVIFYQLLPTDRSSWSDIDGMNETPKESFSLPSDHWEWESDWFLEDNLEGVPLGPEGWSYALDFPMDYGPEGGNLKWVRRRKWIRRKRFVSVNKWISINGVVAGDRNNSKEQSTKKGSKLSIAEEASKVGDGVSFIDVAVGSNVESNGKGIHCVGSNLEK